MSAPRKDYKVPFRSEEAIAQEALALRAAAGIKNLAYFNVVEFVEDRLRVFYTKKGPLIIDLFDATVGDDLAYVTFNPLTLHIDKETWRLARLGEPDARLIVAHEVGHIILHDHHAKAFSNDPSQKLNFVQNEESAEWQATRFAWHFLLPSHIVSAFASIRELAAAASVAENIATERFDAVMEDNARAARISALRSHCEGDACTNCGNFTLVGDGTNRKCVYCEQCQP
jgi:hypothetical protein